MGSLLDEPRRNTGHLCRVNGDPFLEFFPYTIAAHLRWTTCPIARLLCERRTPPGRVPAKNRHT